MPDPTDWLSNQNNPAPPTTPARALDAAFQPSTTKWTLCSYTLQDVATEGQDGSVELRSDAASTPTTSRCSARVKLDSDGAATPGGTFRQQLTYLCPPAHYVKLVSAGTGTWSIVEQVETAIS